MLAVPCLVRDSLELAVGGWAGGLRSYESAVLETLSLSHPSSMTQLLKVSPDKAYVDLIVSFEGGSNDEEIAGPPVRYYIK
jgi:hypothetical protein